MPAPIKYAEIKTSSSGYWGLLLALTLITLIGVVGAHHMEVEGHHVSGMNNQIVWGLPPGSWSTTATT